MNHRNNLRTIVNNSGFLFQIGIAHLVETTKLRHRWDVIAEEVPWFDQRSGRGGYIDLVLGRDAVRMVIECKRVSDGSWIFLLPDQRKRDIDVLKARCMWVKGPDIFPHPDLEKAPVFRAGWFDSHPEPSSALAEFCVVRGSGDDQKPMLERIASQLVDSIECLAIEEVMASYNDGPGKGYIYVPMIVTNADLQVCKFKSAEVNLTTGKLSEGTFDSVPFIRFHKTLTTKPTVGSRPNSLEEAHQSKMRTVLVVNAMHLTKVLGDWHFGPGCSPPW